VVDALVAAVRAAYPRLSHRYYKLKAKWFGRTLSCRTGTATRRCRRSTHRMIPGTRRAIRCSSAYGASRRAGRRSPALLRQPLDRRAGPARQGPGAFAHPTVPSAHPYVLLNYQGKPRDVMTLAHELGHGVHQVLAGPSRAR
jgi:oligoendopeptidase F